METWFIFDFPVSTDISSENLLYQDFNSKSSHTQYKGSEYKESDKVIVDRQFIFFSFSTTFQNYRIRVEIPDQGQKEINHFLRAQNFSKT